MNTVHLSSVYCSQVVTNRANVTFTLLFANILGGKHSFACIFLPLAPLLPFSTLK